MVGNDKTEKLYDSSNPLVLPSKRKRSIKQEGKVKTIQNKVLSKKRKKELQKKLSQKEKKLSVGFVNGKSWKHQSSESDKSVSTDEYSSDDSSECANDQIAEYAIPEKNEFQDDVSSIPICDDDNTTSSMTQSVSDIPRSNLSDSNIQARFVLVSRTDEVKKFRLDLPIIADEASIMESISENDCVIICGATGCGKTTQVPQFLYESGYSLDGYMIGITEPRRVAAISMAKRVGKELNLKPSQVSYHIRYEKTVHKNTLIKFMTDGVLLQEIKQDFELSKYSAIIIDEAHERSIYTDVLLGFISMVIRLRRSRYSKEILTRGRLLPPLKLVIMSATLKVTDFSENRRLFPGLSPPLIHVESRQFPVTCHFAKITYSDYLKAAFRKVVAIHRDSQSNGGILVFVTGQQEVLTLCSWLTRAFPKSLLDDHSTNDFKYECSKIEVHSPQCIDSEIKQISPNQEEIKNNFDANSHIHHIDLDSFDIIPVDEATELGHVRRQRFVKDGLENKDKSELNDDQDNQSDIDEVDDDDDILEQINATRTNLKVKPIQALPLYSLLPSELQQRVFEPPPEGYRQVIVATNVAETSLTIPDIRFVVDTGKVKTKIYEPATGASSFQIVWISQASAEQRAGRAGRTSPGHCYRLYSSQIFSSMKQFTYPDILTRPIDEVVLLLKSFLGNTLLSLFPLPTSPSPEAIEIAERRLVTLDALDEVQIGAHDTVRTISKTGRWMIRMPLPARFSRMLLFANQHNLMPYAVILVACLSVPDLFVPQHLDGITKSEEDLKFQSNFMTQFVRKSDDLLLGDLAIMLGTVCCLERYAAQLNGSLPPETNLLQFCGGQKRISHDPEGAIRILVQRCGIRWNAYKELRQLRRQLTDIVNATIPNIGLTIDPCLPRPNSTQINQLRQLFLVGSPCQVATKLSIPLSGLPAIDRRRLRYAYEIPGQKGPVYIDSNSPLARANYPFIAYLELITTSKPLLHTVCAIDPQWLPFFAPHSFTVDGLVLSDETSSMITATVSDPDNELETDMIGKEEEEEENHELQLSGPQSRPPIFIPSPQYDAERDTVVTGAKTIKYIGTGLVSCSHLSNEHTFIELPNSIVLIPIHCAASIRSIGEKEALTWSVRWFLRFLFEGVVFSEFKAWFPSCIKKSISPQLLTVSWGIIRPEVRNVVTLLVTDDLVNQLSSWLQPNRVSEFHTSWPIVQINTVDNDL